MPISSSTGPVASAGEPAFASSFLAAFWQSSCALSVRFWIDAQSTVEGDSEQAFPGVGALTSPKVAASPERSRAQSSRFPKMRALMIKSGIIPCRHRFLSLSSSLIRLVCSGKLSLKDWGCPTRRLCEGRARV